MSEKKILLDKLMAQIEKGFCPVCGHLIKGSNIEHRYDVMQDTGKYDCHASTGEWCKCFILRGSILAKLMGLEPPTPTQEVNKNEV